MTRLQAQGHLERRRQAGSSPRHVWGARPHGRLDLRRTVTDSGRHTVTVNSWCRQPPVSGALSQRPQETSTHGREWTGWDRAAAPAWQGVGGSSRMDGAQRVSPRNSPRSSAWARDRHPESPAQPRGDRRDQRLPSVASREAGARPCRQGHRWSPAASPTKSPAGGGDFSGEEHGQRPSCEQPNARAKRTA